MSAETDIDLRIPHAPEAEQSVLGALLLDNDAFDRVADLLSELDFFDFRHRSIFAAISALVIANKPADVLSVFDAVSQATPQRVGDQGAVPLAYIASLSQSVASGRNARHHAGIVRERAVERAIWAATDEAATIARKPDPEKPPAAKLDEIVGIFDALANSRHRQGPRPIADLAVPRIDHYTDIAEGNVPLGAATGFEELDRALNGGFQPGRVYVLAARPSVGKTALALQIGLHRAIEAGDGVLVLSQEMPADEVFDRCMASVGRVDYGRMQRGKMNDKDWHGVSAATDYLRQIPVWIDDQSGLTLAQIRSKAFSVRKQGLKLIVLDYLQLCSGTNPGRNSTRNGEIEEITRGLKILAKQLGVAILLLSQLGRDIEKRANPEPNLSDLRDSGAIEQDADVVLFMWRVRQFKDKSIMALGVAKNRQGERGQRIALEFFGYHQRFESSEADVSAESNKPVERASFE